LLGIAGKRGEWPAPEYTSLSYLIYLILFQGHRGQIGLRLFASLCVVLLTILRWQQKRYEHVWFFLQFDHRSNFQFPVIHIVIKQHLLSMHFIFDLTPKKKILLNAVATVPSRRNSIRKYY